MSVIPQSHYEAHSATSYEEAYFYSPGAYMNYLTALVRDQLCIVDDNSSSRQYRRLLDIGGGTGNFTRRLVENAPHIEAIVVDPFLESSTSSSSLEQDDNTNTDRVRFVKASAERFASPKTNNEDWWRSEYHQVLMKEVVHHLNAKDRVAIFRGIQEELQPLHHEKRPSLLIITRPQYDHDYPLWDEARQVWADNQPSLETLEEELKEAGFQHVTHSVEAYPCSTPLERWLDMIKARFWSTFSNFSNGELEEACRRITRDEVKRIDNEGNIHFEDRLLFISARKC